MFDKIINNGNFDMLIKFDEEYPDRNQQDKYEKIVELMNDQTRHQNDFLIANVIVETKKSNENKKDNENNEEQRYVNKNKKKWQRNRR